MNHKKLFTLHTLKHLYKGQTLTRIMMNKALSQETLKGKVLDIGGGHKPDYFHYFQKDKNTTIEPLDFSMSGIDFEKDRLPYNDSSIDTIILCNVLEHLYNYKSILGEIYRVMKNDAQMIGFVPFWVGYHPDPHDYFRYTDECLIKIFKDIGFNKIEIERIGRGPILANFNTIVLSIPRFIRPILFIPSYILDTLFINLRSKSLKRNPFGYIFKVGK